MLLNDIFDQNNDDNCSVIEFLNIWQIIYVQCTFWISGTYICNIRYTYIYYHWKASDIWARLIFSLLIIRLDIASLRYAYYVHLLCPSYHFLCVHFHFFVSTQMNCVFRLLVWTHDWLMMSCVVVLCGLYSRRTFSLKPRLIFGSVFTWAVNHFILQLISNFRENIFHCVFGNGLCRDN